MNYDMPETIVMHCAAVFTFCLHKSPFSHDTNPQHSKFYVVSFYTMPEVIFFSIISQARITRLDSKKFKGETIDCMQMELILDTIVLTIFLGFYFSLSFKSAAFAHTHFGTNSNPIIQINRLIMPQNFNMRSTGRSISIIIHSAKFPALFQTRELEKSRRLQIEQINNSVLDINIWIIRESDKGGDISLTKRNI